MKISIIGAGKLGLPVALAIESKGHKVTIYDTNQDVYEQVFKRKLNYVEEGADELLKTTRIQCATKLDYAINADIIFIAVQTPHEPEYEGITPLPDIRKGFDYTYLKQAVKDICSLLTEDKLVVIISTVLPGTIRNEILPLCNEFMKFVYNPLFIAMGTTITDFLNPEFVLIGNIESSEVITLGKFYDPILGEHDLYKNYFFCTYEEAELIKVSYNTYITTKICLANTINELSYKIGNINPDRVTEALGLATDRIVSTRYMKGGGGDGGACHPRDNIALSWLARKYDLSFDWYENLMMCRQEQTKWLAEHVLKQSRKHHLPLVILGEAFKKNTNIITGSYVQLLTYYLSDLVDQDETFIIYDPLIDTYKIKLTNAVYLIAMNHDIFKEYKFPEGSVIIDPWNEISTL